MKKTIFLSLVIVLVAACGPSPQEECLTGLETYMPEMGDVMDRWTDTIAIADSTPRMSLATPIGSLQEIRRDAKNITPPECLSEQHESMITGMDGMLEIFLGFMADADYEIDSIDLLVSGIPLQAWGEIEVKYDEDPNAFVQLVFDALATATAESTESQEDAGIDE